MSRRRSLLVAIGQGVMNMSGPLLNVNIGAWATGSEPSAVLDAPITSCCGVLAAMDAHGLTDAPVCCVADRAVFLVRCDLDESMSLGRTPAGHEVVYWRSLSELLEAREGLTHAGIWLVEPAHGRINLPSVATILAALWKASLTALWQASDSIGVSTPDLDATVRGLVFQQQQPTSAIHIHDRRLVLS